MNMYGSRVRGIAVVTLAVILIELFGPVISFALTSGPSQPEFAKFEPLGTTGMVNEFNGQFTYNLPIIEIPGPHGSSYPLTLTYKSGATVEEDASWVGYGWSLNPGAIQHAVRGNPDDMNGADVIQVSKQQAVETWVLGQVYSLQAMSMDLFSYDQANRYSTLTGWSSTSGFSISLGAFLSITWRSQNGVSRFTANPNWMNIIQFASESISAVSAEVTTGNQQVSTQESQNANSESVSSSNKAGNEASRGSGEASSSVLKSAAIAFVANYISRSLNDYSHPPIVQETESNTYGVNFAGTLDLSPINVIVGINAGIRGSLTTHETIERESPMLAYGMLYASEMWEGNDEHQKHVLPDFTRERESDYNSRDLYLPPTYSMPDSYVMSGHGVGGVAKLVHGNIGIGGPQAVASSGHSFVFGFETTVSYNKIAGGKHFAYGYNSNHVQRTSLDDEEGSCGTNYSSFVYDDSPVGRRRGVFMRVSGDISDSVRYSTSNSAISPSIYSIDPINNGMRLPDLESFPRRLNNSNSSLTTNRPRSSTNVSFRTNRELSQFVSSHRGIGRSCDSSIRSRNNGVEFIDRSEDKLADGIGEIDVTNPNGMEYVYGLPVYARKEVSLMYNGAHVRGHQKHHNRFVKSYFANDDNTYRTGTIRNEPYATTYLLTEIYTPEYVDLGEQGPGTDDLGGWVSLRYRRVAGSQKKEYSEADADSSKFWYRWRTPYMGYTYAAESMSQAMGDRATVTMGEKEIYYVGSIETKSHVAFFVTNKTQLSLKVAGENRDFSGSGKERMDAFEALNLGKGLETEQEKAMGTYTTIGQRLSTSVDATTKEIGFGKSIGRHNYPTKIDENWWSENNRSNKSEYLEKIILFSKDSVGNLTELLQTVNMEYTYELMQKYPNWTIFNTRYVSASNPSELLPVAEWDTVYYCYGTLNSAFRFTQDSVRSNHLGTMANLAQYGKLTLKRVWTDYGEVKAPFISPYEFCYQYPRIGVNDFAWSDAVFSSGAWTGARDFSSDYTHATTDPWLPLQQRNDRQQNPEYDPVMADPWGSFWRSGPSQGFYHRPWIEQHIDPGEASAGEKFDPAAWQLKMIKLPSQAEIHVQYEANTYSYVQDKPAMAMVAVSAVDLNHAAGKMSCYLDVDVSLEGRGIQNVYDALIEYLKTENRLYFKFLYPIAPCTYTPSDDHPGPSEFISGFVPVEADDVEIVSVSPSGQRLKVTFDARPLPNDLMKEYLYNRDGNFPTCQVENSSSQSIELSSNKKDEIETWEKLSRAGGRIASRTDEIEDLLSGNGPVPYLKYSHIRIPAVWKYGGGVRVKRLFVHDVGIEPGAGGIYGNEYLYNTIENERTISSGVATNEPHAIREENPFFRFTQGRAVQSIYQKITAGDEIDQFAGPICENALPSPDVGYSRVITKSIVDYSMVLTAPGFTISEYFTARDFPIRVEHTNLNKEADFPVLVMTGVLNVQTDAVSATQGYVVHTNSMHGRLRSVSKCAGTPTGQSQVVERISYDYYKPEESKPMLSRASNGTVSIVYRGCGVDEEVAVDARSYSTSTLHAAVPFDIGLMFFLIPVIHIGLPTVNCSSSNVQMSTITRVLSHPALVKSTSLFRRGINTTVQNVAFDELTGQPCVIRTFDELHFTTPESGLHNGVTYDVTIPSYCYYDMMGPRSINDMLTNDDAITASTSGANISLSGSGVNQLSLAVGDLVYVRATSSGTHNIYRVTAQSSGAATLSTGRGTNESDTPTGNVKVSIIQPARSNRLDQTAFAFRRHGVSLELSDVAPSTISNVLKSSATTYSDDWDEYPAISLPSGYNDWDVGRLGRWRPQASYVYRASTVDLVSNDENRSFNTGMTASSMPRFDFGGSNSSSWVLAVASTKYNAHGDAVEERNALGVYSTATFKHMSAVPSMIAQNADAGSICFNSFEDNGDVSTSWHSGKKSKSISSSYTDCGSVVMTDSVKKQGLIVRAWVQFRGNSTTACSLRVGTSDVYKMTMKPQVNGWHLIEREVSSEDLDGFTTGTSQGIALKITDANSCCSTYVDDVRIQPTTSSATCYVYDPATLRLVAQFDDRHYGVVFKYDQEGRLTRKDRETARGVFPLQEAHYNRPTVEYASIEEEMMIEKPKKPLGVSLDEYLPQIDVPLGPMQSGFGGSFDMLKIHADPQRIRYRLFDRDSVDLSADSLFNLLNPKRK